MNNYTSVSRFEFLPLPKIGQIPAGLGDDACQWLDEYIKHAKYWSPRSYEGYHEATGLWALSTIAARRVAYNFGGLKYSNLMIALVGRSGITAKTSAARIGRILIRAAGLTHLLLPDTCTPQKMVNLMCNNLPPKYLQLTREQKVLIDRELPFAGQRGWYYNEFGMLIADMVRKDGVMANFRGLLRIFDDNEDRFENSIISRDSEVIDHPYLALLASMTPADLLKHARIGSTLWGDGFFARFAFVTPPYDFTLDGRFPIEEYIMPITLINPLQDWHEFLGIPKFEIHGTNIVLSPFKYTPLVLSSEAYDHYYNYDSAIRELIIEVGNENLDGNYTRLPEKALRIASLFASLQKSPRIEVSHWGRGQRIVEGWRYSLHELYSQLISNNNFQISTEENVLRAIDKKGSPTKREIEQFTDMKSDVVTPILDKLADEHVVVMTDVGRTIRYQRNKDYGMETAPASSICVEA